MAQYRGQTIAALQIFKVSRSNQIHLTANSGTVKHRNPCRGVNGTNDAYLEVVPSQVLLCWGLEDLSLRVVKASVGNVSEDDVLMKTVSVERKAIQSTKSFFIRQRPRAFDYTRRQAQFALYQGDVSLMAQLRRLLAVFQDRLHLN